MHDKTLFIALNSCKSEMVESIRREDIDLEDWEQIDVSSENPNMLLTSGSILTTDKAMMQNQKIKLMDRAKEDFLKYKSTLKRLKISKFWALFVFFAVQIFSVPRWCWNNENITDEVWCDRENYPNSNIPKISIYYSFPIEMISLIILAIVVVSKRLTRNLTFTEKVREGIGNKLIPYLSIWEFRA